ncbi:MAG: hypothetical protein AAF628_09650 [Planctomycetota bacterium]
MPIAELGYRPWEGTRIPWWRRWLAITRTEIGIASRGSRLLRRFLIIAWTPLLYFAPLFFAVGYVADPQNALDQGGLLSEIAEEALPGPLLDALRADPELLLPACWSVAFYLFFAYTQSFLAMLVIAIVVPPLISRDVRTKAFLLYLSKPISSWGYLLGKLCAALFFVFAMTLFPALVLFAISVALSPNFETVLAVAPILLRIVVAAIAIGVPLSLVALLLSSLTKDHRIAAFGWVAIWIVGEASYQNISLSLARFSDGYQSPPWAYLTSLREVATNAVAAIFDVGGQLGTVVDTLRERGANVEPMVQSFAREFARTDSIQHSLSAALGSNSAAAVQSPWTSLMFLGGLSAICAAVIVRRITKPVRI